MHQTLAIQTLSKNWLLLAMTGVLHAIISVIYFNHAAHGFGPNGAIAFLAKLTLAAAACAIATGIWRSAGGACWPLVLNGLALGALGLIFTGVFGFKISLLTVALLMILLALSMGILELGIARTLRREHHFAEGWFLASCGAFSIAVALVFLAFGLRWIRIEPGSHPDLLWIGSYFAFTACTMLGLALRLHSRDLSQPGPWQALPPLDHPKPAH